MPHGCVWRRSACVQIRQIPAVATAWRCSAFSRWCWSRSIGSTGRVGLFDQLIGDGQSALVFLEFTALTLPNVIRLVLPISAFAAAVYVDEPADAGKRAGGDAGDRLFALAAGAPGRLLRADRGADGRAADECASCPQAAPHWPPAAPRSRRTSPRASCARASSCIRRPASPSTSARSRPTQELLDVFLSDARNPEQRVTYSALRAVLLRSETGPKLVMFDGMAQTLDRNTGRLTVTRFADFTYDLGAFLSPRPVAGRTAGRDADARPAEPDARDGDRTEIHARRAACKKGTAALPTRCWDWPGR